jgi:hypothetical protein
MKNYDEIKLQIIQLYLKGKSRKGIIEENELTGHSFDKLVEPNDPLDRFEKRTINFLSNKDSRNA